MSPGPCDGGIFGGLLMFGIRKFGLRVKTILAATVAMFVALVSIPAHAVLPAGATAAFTDLGTDAGTMIDSGWGLVVLVVGGLLLIKLFRKILSKST